jgi:hypothetical protein
MILDSPLLSLAASSPYEETVEWRSPNFNSRLIEPKNNIWPAPSVVTHTL